MRSTNGTFQPGQSGNPAGRPRGSGVSITAMIRRKLEDLDPVTNGTYAEAIVEMAVRKAARGDFRFFQEIMNRMDGRLKPQAADDNGIDICRTIEELAQRTRAEREARAAGVHADE